MAETTGSDPNRERRRCERYLAQCLGGDVRLVQATRLQKSSREAPWRLDVGVNGVPRSYVLRLESRRIEHEVEVLRAVEPLPIPAPRAYGWDPHGQALGVPCFLATQSVRHQGRLRFTERNGMSLPIETERLTLRKYEDRDMADILEYSLDADFWLARNLDWEASEEGVKAYWEAQREIDPSADPEWLSLVVVLKGEGKVIGHIGIGIIKVEAGRQGIIGWLFGRQYQGQGLATEAARALLTYGFDHLALHRIIARTGQDNTRSWHLMERLGMRREAHFKQSHIVNGEWRDEYVYAVLADEWRAQEGL